MNGEQIFNRYLDQRDFSGNANDVYAQLLQTINLSIGDELYPLLEDAETKGKKLAIKAPEDEEMLIDSISINDLYLV